METYEFSVLHRDATIAVEYAALPPTLSAILVRLAKLVATIDHDDCDIRVSNGSGEQVIAMGIMTARRSLGLGFAV